MSQNRCNFCVYADLVKVANASDPPRWVSHVPNTLEGHFPKGQDIYIHPPDEHYSGWWAAWLAEIPDHCCCAED